MPDLDFYLKLIPSQHKDKPKFMAMVRARIEFYVRMQELFASMTREFNLDHSVGVQLDQNGEWIGRTRYLNIPMEGVYFSWGVHDLGWSEGTWKSNKDAETGLIKLPDDVFRRLLKAKVAANHWDGTIPGAYKVWRIAFEDTGSILFIEDCGDMSMNICIAGTPPDAVMKGLMKEGYLPLKPEGVRMGGYLTTPGGGAFFGWGCESEAIHGWCRGNWPVSI